VLISMDVVWKVGKYFKIHENEQGAVPKSGENLFEL
jgi:hypothetical protein